MRESIREMIETIVHHYIKKKQTIKEKYKYENYSNSNVSCLLKSINLGHRNYITILLYRLRIKANRAVYK